MCVSGFLEKNRDALSADVIELVETSTNQLLKQAFKTDLAPGTARGGGNSRMTMTTPKNSLRVRAAPLALVQILKLHANCRLRG